MSSWGFDVDRYLAYISHITDLKEDLLRSLEFVEWKNQIEKGSTVFVKPNFTYPYYKEGITTNPELLRNLLEILKDRAGDVIVGESNGGNNSFTADNAFSGHDMYSICREAGVNLVNLSKMPSVPVEDTIQGTKVKVLLPKLLLNEIDCFISVPVLKVHVMTTVTLSIKNLWGCYPDTMRCLHHQHLSRKLTLITKMLNPKLVVIDGIYALNGHGPMYGEAKKTNILISSNNPVVADSLGTAVMGIPLKNVESILMASNEGLGITDLSKVKMNDDWKKFSMDFQVKRTLVDNLSSLLFNSEILAKIVMCSPFTPIAYGLVKYLRNPQEQTVVDELKNR